jgi:hypothetical protein
MTREKQKEIQWFLDFIHVEIGKLSQEERMEIAAGLQRYTHYPPQLAKSSEKAPIRKGLFKFLSNLTDPDRLVSFQNRVADFFGFMTWRMALAQNIANKGWTPVEETDFFPSLNRGDININFELKIEGLSYDKKTGNENSKKYKLKKESLENAVISICYDAPAEAEKSMVLYNFITLIDGVPISAFKNCPECGKWFINLTKKEKIFCNNRCAARYRQRERRLELNQKAANGDDDAIKKREAELEKARARARKAYVKKVKEKQSNVAIKKNPRKPQRKEKSK